MDTATKKRKQQIEFVHRLRTKWNANHPDSSLTPDQSHDIISDMCCMVSGVELDISVPLLVPTLQVNGSDIEAVAFGVDYFDGLSAHQLKQIKVLVLRAEKKFKE